MKDVTAKDKIEFNRAEQLIFKKMSDGKWHTATELIRLTGQREALRRMRELRKRRSVLDIQKRRESDSREWSYKMDLAI